jgi:hypothetical protein
VDRDRLAALGHSAARQAECGQESQHTHAPPPPAR